MNIKEKKISPILSPEQIITAESSLYYFIHVSLHQSAPLLPSFFSSSSGWHSPQCSCGAAFARDSQSCPAKPTHRWAYSSVGTKRVDLAWTWPSHSSCTSDWGEKKKSAFSDCQVVWGLISFQRQKWKKHQGKPSESHFRLCLSVTRPSPPPKDPAHYKYKEAYEKEPCLQQVQMHQEQ